MLSGGGSKPWPSNQKPVPLASITSQGRLRHHAKVTASTAALVVAARSHCADRGVKHCSADCDRRQQSPVDPASVAALGALGLAATSALWKIANGLGRFEARTLVIMDGMQTMLKDHETRIREVEKMR